MQDCFEKSVETSTVHKQGGELFVTPEICTVEPESFACKLLKY